MTEFNTAYVPILELKLLEYNRKQIKANWPVLDIEIEDDNKVVLYNSVQHGICAVRKVWIEFKHIEWSPLGKKDIEFIEHLEEENSLYNGDDLCEKTYKAGSYGIPTSDYLRYVCADDNAYGFAPITGDSIISTADSTVFNYFGNTKPSRSYDEEIKVVTEWLSEYTPESDYEQRLKESIRQEYIWYQDAIILASVFETHRRYVKNLADRRTNVHLGCVNKMFETLVRFKSVRTFCTEYGRYYDYTFEDKRGNEIVWKTETIVNYENMRGFTMCRMKIFAHMNSPYKQTRVRYFKPCS